MYFLIIQALNFLVLLIQIKTEYFLGNLKGSKLGLLLYATFSFICVCPKSVGCSLYHIPESREE